MNSLNKFYKLSWSDIRIFFECERCFYNQKVHYIRRPGPDPESFKLSAMAEKNLKKEIAVFRGWKPYPHITNNNDLSGIPHECEQLEKWRDAWNKGGIAFYDRENNLELFGGIDDLWINQEGELIIIEYKISAKAENKSIENDPWYHTHKQQLAFYAYLLKINNHKVHDHGYFIYCNGVQDDLSFLPFDAKLKFETTLTSCEIDDSWVDETIKNIRKLLNQDSPPQASKNCKHCSYAAKLSRINQ